MGSGTRPVQTQLFKKKKIFGQKPLPPLPPVNVFIIIIVIILSSSSSLSSPFYHHQCHYHHLYQCHFHQYHCYYYLQHPSTTFIIHFDWPPSCRIIYSTALYCRRCQKCEGSKKAWSTTADFIEDVSSDGGPFNLSVTVYTQLPGRLPQFFFCLFPGGGGGGSQFLIEAT